jgi:copper chaperone CopZ|tara:strand:+ start:1755 stop:2276 length:522 start_codon:yes stop_codon:yes gene_type:complete
MKKNIHKYIIFCLIIFLPWIAQGQFKSVEMGIDGLTCSMCSRSVEMSLVKLDFIDRVEMDLNSNRSEIFFNEEMYVSIDKVAQAVTDAGFSVAYLNASFDFKEQSIDTDACWNYAYDTYQFLDVSQPQLKGEMILKFLGTNFLSRSEMKKWKTQLSAAKNKTCPQNEHYFVTI